MKKILAFLTVVFVFVACNNAPKQEEGQERTYPDENTIMEFGEFMSWFSTDESFQKEHTRLPLTLINTKSNKQKTIEEWKPLKLAFGSEFSSILFNDTAIDYDRSFFMEKIDEKGMVISVFHLYDELWNPWYDESGKRLFFWDYHFAKEGNSWQLEKIVAKPFVKKRMKRNECFFHFLAQFASDEVFYKERIHQNAQFKVLDDVAGEIIDMDVDLDKEFLDEYIYKEVFVNDFDFKSDAHVLYIKGEGTGYNLKQYFQRIKGKWYLMQEIDTGM